MTAASPRAIPCAGSARRVPGTLLRDRLRPKGKESARPRSGAYSTARARPYYTASPPLFPKESRVSTAAGELSGSVSRRASLGKLDHDARAQYRERSAAPAARRLTPHPRYSPAQPGALHPLSPRSAWRAISPHSGHSASRVSPPPERSRCASLRGSPPGPCPATSPHQKERTSRQAPESGRLKRRLCL